MTTMKRSTLAAFAVATLFAGLMGTTPETEAQQRNIVTTATEAGAFSTLVAAVKAAGLDSALAEDGPFTVFAPTDEAFAKLPDGTVETLLGDPETLRAILSYHVVHGKKLATEVVASSELESLNGKALRISVGETGVKIAEATVVETDIEAGNGIIHVIDSVMLPPTE
jgi:uncharacterized surface protein with fasciclin (FAS1) repeats